VPWKPSAPGEVPTLGWYVIDWIAQHLAAPDRAEFEPFRLYREQEDFVLQLYQLHPVTGKRLRRRGGLSRPRGWGKSPLLASLAIVEALADVVPDGWDANGQPVGRPWSTVRTPWVQVAAVAEAQTRNTWTPLLQMCDSKALLDAYSIDPMDTFVALPNRGRMEPITSAARTVKGNKPHFAVCDQTEEWVSSNGGTKLFQTMLINATKIGGSLVESPNAFTPGEDSVAETSAKYWEAIRLGKARDEGLHYDHREAPPETDLEDRESLMAGLRIAYGDSSGHPDGCVLHDPPCGPGHVDLDVIAASVWDPAISPQTAQADFFNMVMHAADAFMSPPHWAGCKDEDRIVHPQTLITLGFDGSRGRAKGKPDATALIGCTVTDGHLFELGVWEAPDGPDQSKWAPPLPEIEAAIAHAFRTYRVVAMYADPAKDWRSHVNSWEAKYSARVKVKVRPAHPFEWWMTGGRSEINQRAIEAFGGAVRNGDLSHSGGYALTKHVLNARRRIVHAKLALGKAHDYSPNKIDAAVAAVLAWQARLDAIAKGIGAKKMIRRVR
jgi:hypothetical protein